jgi:D-amino-acid dehydrogenase
VIGGGVIGLCCAYSLCRRGHEVTVVDAGEMGMGASAGNGGWVCPSLGWLFRRNSPLRIHESLDPSFAGWLISFASHCNASAYLRGLDAVGRMALSAPERFQQLSTDGVEFESHDLGVLLLFTRQDLAEAEMATLQRLQDLGIPPAEWIQGDALVETEPAASDSGLIGVLSPGDRHVRPESLTRGLVVWLLHHGVKLRSATGVARLVARRNSVSFAETDGKDRLEADTFVIAAGTGTAKLARQVGVRIPLRGGKGYSVTYPAAYPKVKHALYLSEAKVAISPYQDGVRVLGTMELGTESMEINRGRVEAMLRATRHYLPALALEGEGISWAGMRPMVPDGLPVIGQPSENANVAIATGHAMLGVTLAPATGEMVADVLEGKPNAWPSAVFSPLRF